MTTIAVDAATSPAKRLPEHALSPATLTICGAGGDLTKRLIMPALYNLVRARKLPDGFAIIGVDHKDQTSEQGCQSLAEMMQAFIRARGQGKPLDEQAWSWLVSRMHYMRGDFMQPETYRQLEKLLLDQRGRQNGTANVLFYLAVADPFFGPGIENLGPAGVPRQSQKSWPPSVVG